MRYEEFIEIREWLLKRAGSTNPYRVDKEKLKEGYASGAEERGYSCLQANEDIDGWQRPAIYNRITVQLQSNYYLVKER